MAAATTIFRGSAGAITISEFQRDESGIDDGVEDLMNAFTKQDAREAAIADHPSSQRPLDEGAADPRRRRLVKGVAAVAPAVLTLRSGALLAASSICPGQVMMTATVNSDGTLHIGDQYYDFQSSQITGHCYGQVSSNAACDQNHISDVGDPYGILQSTDENDGSGTSIVYTCSGFEGSPPEAGTPIVIITQSSVISLV